MSGFNPNAGSFNPNAGSFQPSGGAPPFQPGRPYNPYAQQGGQQQPGANLTDYYNQYNAGGYGGGYGEYPLIAPNAFLERADSPRCDLQVDTEGTLNKVDTPGSLSRCLRVTARTIPSRNSTTRTPTTLPLANSKLPSATRPPLRRLPSLALFRTRTLPPPRQSRSRSEANPSLFPLRPPPSLTSPLPSRSRSEEVRRRRRRPRTRRPDLRNLRLRRLAPPRLLLRRLPLPRPRRPMRN